MTSRDEKLAEIKDNYIISEDEIKWLIEQLELEIAKGRRLVELAWSFDDYAKHNDSCRLTRGADCTCGLTEARNKFRKFREESEKD